MGLQKGEEDYPGSHGLEAERQVNLSTERSGATRAILCIQRMMAPAAGSQNTGPHTCECSGTRLGVAGVGWGNWG